MSLPEIQNVLSRIWPNWRRAVQIVTPDTVVGWHRRGFALYWRWRSRPRRPGRPAVAVDIRALIRQMQAANPLWGAPRIHGELAKLGLKSLDKDAPVPRAVQPVTCGPIVQVPHLGGLHHYYVRRAA